VPKFNFSDARRGAALSVKVIPRARQTALAGVMDDGTLKVRLAAPPVDGAANKALVEFLAEILDLPKNQIDIVAGHTSERKLVSLLGVSPEQVDAVIKALLSDADKEDEGGTRPKARRS
jgi:uncharacterized protein (TIGR00251 family)